LFDAAGPGVDIFVGESGEWVYANFELSVFGVEHPTGQDISYAEGVTLFSEAFWAGGGQPEQSSVFSGPAQLRLDYATNSLALTNVSGGNINMTGLSFSGGAGSWDILGWNTSSLGRPLDNFPNGNCLQLYPFGQDRPAIPSACNFSQGWITTGDSSAFFWRGDFSVLHNGSQVASCRSGDGVCSFRLDGSASSGGSDSGTVSTSCPGAPPTAFQVGDTAIIDFNAGGSLILTFSPQGTGQDSDFIIEMFDNTELRILDGPVCGRNGDRWRWQVEVVGRNLTGWASEGIRDDAWMCPVGNPECGS
jgi:hypothetical protein